jgi:hypothetical protein
LLTSCGPPLPVNDIPPNLPLDERGLPPHFSLCVRNAVEKRTQVYDIFYPCRGELITYVVRTNGLDPTSKSEMLDEFEKRGMNYAHDMAVARWGEKSRPPISVPPPEPPPREPVPVIVSPPVKAEKPDIRM